MKKTGTIKTKVFAGVIAAVCAVSAISTGAIVGASAHSSASTTVIESRTSSSVFTLPMKGVDWNYYADSLDVLVDCEIDFNYNLCNFKFTAVRPGAANITLQTKDTYGVWTNTPIRITADKNLRMKIVQTGDAVAANNDNSNIKYVVDENETAAEIVNRTSGNVFDLPMKGIDWNYSADSLNVKVSGDVDYNSNLCKFTLKAVKPGITNITLQTKDTCGTWTNTPIRVTVGNDLRMNIVQTGDSTIIYDNSPVEDYTAEKNDQIESNEHKDYWMNEYAGTTRQDAVILAESSLGDEWSFRSAQQGEYEGVDAWAIALENEEGNVRVAFVNGTDCYF